MNWIDENHIIPKTISTVFPFVKQYGFFCIASNSELEEDSAFKYKEFDRFPNYKNALLEIDSNERTPQTRPTILSENRDYPINEDFKPWCEYFIGLKIFKHYNVYK